MRYDPRRPTKWPWTFRVTAPARWPAGRHWRLRFALAAPFRFVDAVAYYAGRPFAAIATFIEGQPEGTLATAPGWRRMFLPVNGQRWVYDGPVTPEIRTMYRDHPERFSRSHVVVAEIEAGQ